MAAWLAVPVAVLVVGSACSSQGTQPPACQHPCDLAQSVRVEFTGADQAATVAVSAPCTSNVTCPASTGCASADILLTPPGATAGPDLTCHLTVTTRGGQTVQRDLVAHYLSTSCCSGYEFATPTVSVTLGAPDGGGAD